MKKTAPDRSRRRRCGALTALLLSCLAAGCSSPVPQILPTGESDAVFSGVDTFSRSYAIPPQESCEAARRALLSQAYLITSNQDNTVSARKSFQRSNDSHFEVDFHVTCVANPGGSSTIFVSAVQQLYGLRTTSSSASVGVGIFGSLSVPIKSAADSLVKIGSATLTRPELYQQFFQLVENNITALEEVTMPAVRGRMPVDPEKARTTADNAGKPAVLVPDETLHQHIETNGAEQPAETPRKRPGGTGQAMPDALTE